MDDRFDLTFNRNAAKTDLDNARLTLSGLCKGDRFRMCIPAQPHTDTNLVLSAGLRAGELALREIERLERPIDMVIHCPKCGVQHIDKPEPEKWWYNPPHKSHLCRREDGGCGLIFRTADVATNGIARVASRGEEDTWPVVAEEVASATE